MEEDRLNETYRYLSQSGWGNNVTPCYDFEESRGKLLQLSSRVKDIEVVGAYAENDIAKVIELALKLGLKIHSPEDMLFFKEGNSDLVNYVNGLEKKLPTFEEINDTRIKQEIQKYDCNFEKGSYIFTPITTIEQ